MEFSKLRCEDEQDAMKPAKIQHGEDVYLMGQQSSAGATLATLGVVEFSSCYRGRENTLTTFMPDAQRYILWFCSANGARNTWHIV